MGRSDSYYEPDATNYDSEDEEFDPDYDPNETDTSDVDERFLRDREEWIIDYGDVLLGLYSDLKTKGTEIFGEAFLQCGSFTNFCNYVYKFTQAGA